MLALQHRFCLANPHAMNSTSPTHDDFCARQLKVLADRARLSILQLLRERPRCVSELNHHLNMEQSLLSHHLKVLRQAGFVEAAREGKSVRYQLTQPDKFSDVNAINLGCCNLSFD